jgi:mono/diheme cytochrome c family protein
MKPTVLMAMAIMLTIFASSCYYDKEELLYGGGSASCADATGIVSYSQKVVPLLSQQCYSCHSGGSPGGGIRMGTYATDKAIGQNGTLYGSINHSSGYSKMPQGSPKMSSCQIAMVKKWIDDGMLNN